MSTEPQPRTLAAPRRGDIQRWSRTFIPTSKEAPADADAVIEQTADFRVQACWQPDPEDPARECGGVLKPDIVYFGEQVPRDRVAQALMQLADAGIVVSDFSFGQPSLDEVFLTLTGRPAEDDDTTTEAP